MAALQLVESEEQLSDRPDLFVSMPEMQATMLALIQAQRASTDAVDRLAKAFEERDSWRAEITREMSSMSTRLALIEASGLRTRIEAFERELEELKEDQFLRRGREGVWAALLRSPVVAWLAAAGAGITALFAWMKGGVG